MIISLLPEHARRLATVLMTGLIAAALALLPMVPATAQGDAVPPAGSTSSDGPAVHAQDGAPRPGRMLRLWAYLGPRAELARARVVVRDSRGQVIAKGRTTRHGTFARPIERRVATTAALPLTVKTSGGTVVGKRFRGTMKARVHSLRATSPVVQVSLASTAATAMATQRKGYAKATRKVRRTLGIAKGSMVDSMRYRNSDVGYRQLMRKIRKTNGGFNGLARLAAGKAEKGKVLRGLRPPTASKSGPPRRVRSAQVVATDAPVTSVCSAPVPTNGTTSEEVISDIAEIGVGGLLEYSGVPATSADGITGMLLSPIGEDPQTTILQEDVQAVMTELTCISEQINYLSAQVAALQFTVDVDTATSCSNAVTPAFYDYTFLVNNASADPISAQNNSLLTDLPLWNDLNGTCGSAINNMLFGTAGGQASAWQQLNQNYSAGVQWYTQAEVQDLQTFLSYWGTILYQQFVLTNEFYNFYGDWEQAEANAGGTNPGGTSPVCSDGSGPQTPTYCVWQNSIAAAFPDDLYSDEIGIIASGLGVNANPGGMIAQKPIFMSESQTEAIYLQDTSATANESYTPTAMTGSWWYNYSLNFVEYSPSQYSGAPPVTFNTDGDVSCGFPGYPQGCFPSGSPTATWNWPIASANQFNEQGVNPQGYGSAVQTFWNPQSTDRQAVTKSQISALTSKGPDGASATQVLYDAINQTPAPYPSGYAAGGAWSQFAEGNAAFWTNDSSSWITMEIEAVLSTFTIAMTQGVALGNGSGWSVGGTTVPTQPIYAYLTGRTWWPEAASAASFEPPQPPTG